MSAIAITGAAPRAAGTSPVTARRVQLLAFSGLAIFGALHWAALMRPAPFGRMLGCAALALVVLVAAEQAARIGGWARLVAYAALAAAFVAAALLVAGVPLRLLAPARWNDLSSGIGQG